MIETVKKIENWADNKGLIKKENSFAQMCKVTEEIGEVASALAKKDIVNLKDGIGDSIVTLVILAKQNGLNVEDCLESAWGEISNRTGKLVDGVFIKDK